LAGLAAFSCVIFAAPFQSQALFFLGAGMIGFGGGLFAISTLTAAMSLPAEGLAGRGLALGAWGAAQATAAGISIAVGGTLRDVINHSALAGNLGEVLNTPATGYATVYQIEIALIFITLIALGPLVSRSSLSNDDATNGKGIGLADFPT
jgi:BCD family chlorophyll transporter-like MFS transporter